MLLIIFSLLHAILIAPDHKESEDEIRWAQRASLTFQDFNGNIPSNTSWAALTSSYIYFTYGTSNGKLSRFSVYAAFRKKESWIKIKKEEVLKHEQLHFDITEIFARKLYKDASALKEKSGDIPAQASELFKQINEECDRMQQLYDEQTEHGTVEEAQSDWSNKVNKLLQQYEPYPD